MLWVLQDSLSAFASAVRHGSPNLATKRFELPARADKFCLMPCRGFDVHDTARFFSVIKAGHASYRQKPQLDQLRRYKRILLVGSRAAIYPPDSA